jgi:hypothetical protein
LKNRLRYGVAHDFFHVSKSKFLASSAFVDSWQMYYEQGRTIVPVPPQLEQLVGSTSKRVS